MRQNEQKNDHFFRKFSKLTVWSAPRTGPLRTKKFPVLPVPAGPDEKVPRTPRTSRPGRKSSRYSPYRPGMGMPTQKSMGIPSMGMSMGMGMGMGMPTPCVVLQRRQSTYSNQTLI
jgi:hypothetical protein